nr:unnamed protein product [Callosobruchus chinensis]
MRKPQYQDEFTPGDVSEAWFLYMTFFKFLESFHGGEARKDPDAVYRLLLHYIENNIPPKITKLRLFCDGCSGQNHKIIMGYLGCTCFLPSSLGYAACHSSQLITLAKMHQPGFCRCVLQNGMRVKDYKMVDSEMVDGFKKITLEYENSIDHLERNDMLQLLKLTHILTCKRLAKLLSATLLTYIINLMIAISFLETMPPVTHFSMQFQKLKSQSARCNMQQQNFNIL